MKREKNLRLPLFSGGRGNVLYRRLGLLLALGALAVGGCQRKPGDSGAGRNSSPARSPAATGPDWPAFHGGGPLLGTAPPIGTTPLSLRWTFKAGGDDSAPINGSAAIVGGAYGGANGVAFVADGAGVLHALDLRTGKPRWEFKSDSGFETSPLFFEGKVLLGDDGGKFYCLRANDGKKLWDFDAEAGIHSSANAWGTGESARVAFGSDGGTFFCLKLADGSKAWEQSVGEKVNGTPAVGAGAVFVAGCDAHLHAIKLEDGGEKFTADPGGICPGSPALAADRILVGTQSGQLVCFNPDGSKQLWVYDQADGQMMLSSPAVADGTVVVGARDRKVHAMDLATGRRKWVFPTRGDVDSSPAISGGRVYVGSRDKKLYVLDLQTGKRLGEFDTGYPVTGSPAIAQGVVIVGDAGGNVYCLEPK